MKQFSELLLLEPVSRVHAARAEENAEVSDCATAQWFKNRPDELKKY